MDADYLCRKCGGALRGLQPIPDEQGQTFLVGPCDGCGHVNWLQVSKQNDKKE
jgi:hypothetical protein